MHPRLNFKPEFSNNNKKYPCKFYILSNCTSRNCKFSHNEKMRSDFSNNPCCPHFKTSGTCKFDSNCIFSNFHKHCKYFEKNQCSKLNCSYYHYLNPASILKNFLTNPETMQMIKNEFMSEFEKKLNIDEKKPDVEKNEQTCAICLVKKADHIALPCGHLRYCSECSQGLDKCLICKKKVGMTKKVYS